MTEGELSTADTGDEVSALIRTLNGNVQRLAELTGGQVDSIADNEGRNLLLQEAQDDLRQRGVVKQASILNALPAHIALLDAQGLIVSVNEAWSEFADANFLQFSEHGVGVNYLQICDSAEGEGSAEAHQAAIGIRSILDLSAKCFSFEYSCHSPTEQRWFLMKVTPLADDRRAGAVVMHVSTSEEKRYASESKIMEEALFDEKERAQVTLNSIGDAVACTDLSGNITYLNVVAERMLGWSLSEVQELPMGEVLRIVDGTSREPTFSPTDMAVGRDRIVHVPSNSILICRDGSEISIEDSIAPIHDRKGLTTGAVIVFRDVRVARAMALQMTHSAQHDYLTGLPNRMLLNERIEQAIVLARRHTNKVGVLFLDLDGFKHINDSLGHPVGDALLQSIGKRLVECVRVTDTVSRQGGDEFVILLSEVHGPDDITILAKRLLQTVAESHSADTHELHVTTSIGVSVYPDDGLDAETLIKNADTAMYQAKANGRQSYQFFTSAMNVRAVERQSLEEGLRRALERREFELYYQPKVDLQSGAVTGAEALIRWTHPTRGLVSPAQFIPIAEECGLILPIGAWVLREACSQAQAWVEAGLPALAIAVNVSAMEFRDKNFVESLYTVLEETRLHPTSLELEITEGVLMKHVESSAKILQALREKGIRVALDDFGTGYSSLSYLRKFPVDSLKIDQSFVRQIGAAKDDTAIVTAVIGMARSLKLRVVAEGVETREELEFLKANGCDEAQGYYFSRPVPAPQFAKMLKSGVTTFLSADDFSRSSSRETRRSFQATLRAEQNCSDKVGSSSAFDRPN